MNRKKYTSNSLRIINGKRIYGGTKECYQFAEISKCLAGVFCAFDHNGDNKHQSTNLCIRFIKFIFMYSFFYRNLKGLCRNETNCKYGNHNLLAEHQRPVCDYFLRIICAKNDCTYLHVKHTDGLEPCVNFNRGVCQLGVMVC